MRDNSIQDVFRLVDREIWIVTSISRAAHPSKDAAEKAANDSSVVRSSSRGGLVATWVNQASIDSHHPSVIIGIAANHFTAKLIDASSAFGLHLLRPEQTDVAFNFAIGSGNDRDKLADVASRSVETGSPILDDCLAWLDCQVYYRFNGGDRIYYFADVVASEIAESSNARPMTESQLVAAATDSQKTALKESLDSDVIKQRPKYREWREQLGDHPHPKFS